MSAAGAWTDRWLPGVRVARSYDRRWARRDVLSGLVLAAILVPQGMAYAELAGLPAVTGLYTTVACLVAYALFGPSRVLVLGPDSSVSPLIFAALTPLAVVGSDRAIEIAGMLAVIVGVIEIAVGLCRLGFVADLLANEVQVGYMNGLAVTIVVGQLPKLFGFSTDADSFFGEIRAFVEHLDETQVAALAVGLAVLATLFLLPKFVPRVPAVLIAMVGATVVSGVLDLGAKGVATVGTLPSGLPRPAVPWTSIHDVIPLIAAAVGIVVVSLTDTIATASSFAARRGEEVKPNQEILAIGAANVSAALFQGFAVSTSGSRTAVAERSGAKSQAAGVVGAAVVVTLLVFFNSLLADLPQSALAAVVVFAAFSLVDLGALRWYARAGPSAMALSVATSVGVIAFGVLEGIAIAIALDVLAFFRRSWWPHGEVLGHVEGSGWHSVAAYPEAVEAPGILVYRWEAPLFFANARAFREQIRGLVRDRNPSAVVVQCEAITDVDVTGAQMLAQLDAELRERGVELVLAELRTRLQEVLGRSGLFEGVDRARFFPEVEAAVRTIQEEH